MSGTRLLSQEAPATEADGLPALLIVAHGERGGLGDDRLVHDLAGSLAKSSRFSTVQGCFISKEPSLKHAFEKLSPGPVTVYPLFMSDGYFVRRAIPRSLGLNASAPDAGLRPVEILSPVGLNRHLPHLVSDLGLSTIEQTCLDARDCQLLLVAHGSKHDDASRKATLSVAAEMEKTKSFAGVEVGFLEESPFLDEQLARIKGPAIAVGLFVGEGMHGAIDLPGAIGKSGRDDVFQAPPLTRSPGLKDLIMEDLLGVRAPSLARHCLPGD